MKTLVAITIMILEALACWGAYEGGKFQAQIERQPMEVAQQCAYYSMDDGKFTWGPRPVTIDKSLEEGIAVPSKKPAVRK